MPLHEVMIAFASGISQGCFVLSAIFAIFDWPKLSATSTRLGDSPWMFAAFLFLLTNKILEFCKSKDQDVINLDAIIIAILLITLVWRFIRTWKKTQPSH